MASLPQAQALPPREKGVQETAKLSSLTEFKHPIWYDPNTGLALGGFDPVAYMVEGRAMRGREGVEITWGGGIWRFRNIGNRAAFARHPEIYAPMFGGHDPHALARGEILPGHPRIWVRYRGNIYFFHNAASKYLWLESAETLLRKARAAWPRLRRDVARLP